MRKKYDCGAAGNRARGRILLLGAALLAATAFAPFAVLAEDAPLAGIAYTNATEAYAAFKKGDYPVAIAKTKEAIKMRPDSLHLRLLLIDVLYAAEKYEEADAAATEAISQLGSNPEIVTRQANIRERIGYKEKAEIYAHADNALKAFARQDYQTAVSEATKAVAADPKNRSYRLILINSLIASNDFDEAKKQIEEAIAKVGSDAELQARQQFVAERIAARPRQEAFAAAEAAYKAFNEKDYPKAAEYARKAIELDPENRSYQTLLKNIERMAHAPVGRTMSRGEVLAQRGYAKQRRGDYAGAAAEFAAAIRAGLPAASRRTVSLALADSYQAANDPQSALDALSSFGETSSYDVQIRRGYALQSMKRWPEAIEAFELAGRAARNPRDRSTALMAEITLLAQTGRMAEARARFDEALANGELRSASADQIANVASIVGNEQVAIEYFNQMRSSRTLRGNSILTAGYIATRLNRTPEAIAYFEDAVDAYHAGSLPLDPQALFTLRRQISEMSRTWGVYASATYSKSGSGPGVIFAPPSPGINTLQLGSELYWRPFGYLNGSVFDIFVRAFVTPWSENGGVGAKTTQGMWGARWKPIGQLNWIVEAAQVFKIGDASRNDFLLRTAYSDGRGTDLRVDVPSWFTWQFYADFNHYTEISQNTANADLRIGYSYRWDAIDPHLVFFPHVGVFASYDNKLATPEAYALGAGATWRYWFREDKYHAPMSYVDLTAQYRFRIGGDDRAQGFFGQVLVSY